MTDTIPDATSVQKILVADLPEGREVTTYFVALDKEPATDRNGKSFLRLKLRDASGEVKAIHFDPDETVVGDLVSGDVVKVSGTYSVHEKFGQQFQVKRLSIMAPGEYDIGTLAAVSPVPLDELERRLAHLVATVHSPSLHALLVRAFDPSTEPGATFVVVPAAVRNHHAYRHGLLEHSLIVAEVAAAVAERFTTVNRDLTVAGALLHDIGKVQSIRPTPWRRASPTPADCTARSSSATTSCVASLSRSPGFRPSCPSSYATSSSPITASARRAARWCRPPARPSSCTTATT